MLACLVLLTGCFTEFPAGVSDNALPRAAADVAADQPARPQDMARPQPDGADMARDLGPDVAEDVGPPRDQGADAFMIPDARGDLPCVAAAEVCDGVDQDCDGRADEAIPPRPCPEALGICAELSDRCEGGAYRGCGDRGGLPDYEREERRCDGLDNDCDGNTDEGCGCVDGQTQPCGPPTEAGVCQRGEQRCVQGAFGPCDGAVGPQPEGCNQLDDDCDERVDEETGGGACEAGVGQCGAGVERCQGGALDCTPLNAPRDEVCDNLDQDCDGQVDEGAGGRPCLTPEAGPCASGITVCEGGAERCVPDVVPTPEVCDGDDDDCDGEVDEGTDQNEQVCQAEGGCVGTRRCVNGALACVPLEPCEPIPLGPFVLRLEDLMVGGRGFAPGAQRQILPGFQPNEVLGGPEGRGWAVPDVPVVDRVFRLNVTQGGQTQISSTGLMVDFSDGVGQDRSWRAPAKGPLNYAGDPGVPTDDDGQPEDILELPPNLGITFDLDVVRAEYPQHQLTHFRFIAGIATVGPTGAVAVRLDGDDQHGECVLGPDRTDPVEIEVEDGVRFLSLITTDCGGELADTHTYFLNASLSFQPIP